MYVYIHLPSKCTICASEHRVVLFYLAFPICSCVKFSVISHATAKPPLYEFVPVIFGFVNCSELWQTCMKYEIWSIKTACGLLAAKLSPLNRSFIKKFTSNAYVCMPRCLSDNPQLLPPAFLHQTRIKCIFDGQQLFLRNRNYHTAPVLSMFFLFKGCTCELYIL